MMQLLDMVETNELNRSLLTLLDENIANAHMANQVWEALLFIKQVFASIAYLFFIYKIHRSFREPD